MVDSIFFDNLLRNRKLILVTGKGGIGKTLIAASLAKRATALGLRVLLVEQSSVGQLGPLLGTEGVTHEERWNGNLGIANFTAAGNFKDFITKHLMKSGLLEILISNKLVNSFFTAIPGFGELMLLGRLYYAINLAPKKPDIIIVDAYASGHFLSLMTTPDAILKSGLAGPISHLTQKVKDWLSDEEQCATLYISTPEELVVSEALDFLPVLVNKSPVHMAALIMNRSMIHSSNKSEEAGSIAGKFILDRRRRQENALKILERGVLGNQALKLKPIIRLPELGAVEEPLDQATAERLLRGEH